MEEKNVKQAQAVFRSVCEMLDEHGWRYSKDESNLLISCSARGEDLPMEIRIRINDDLQIITLYSQMPFLIPENRRKALAVAVCAANNSLVDGSFDYDYRTGGIVFRLTSSYRDSLIGKDVFEYMLMCSFAMVDEYNDKFLMVAKSEMSNEEILNFIG